MTRPFEAHRAKRLEDVNARYAAYLNEGFPTADFDGQPEPETLQCRDETDQIRWIALLLKCQTAIQLGAGDLPIDPPIRCTSNREYAVSHSDAAQRMFALLSVYGVALKNFWRLKDAVRACPTRSELKHVNLEEGWP